MNKDQVAHAFKAWSNSESQRPDLLLSDDIEIYKGPQVYKSASLRVFADRATGGVQRRELRLRRYPTREVGPGYDFEAGGQQWYCEDEQIDRVRALLDGDFAQPGHYVRLDDDIDVAGLTQTLSGGVVDAATLVKFISALAAVPGVAEALANTDAALMFETAVQRSRQQAALDALTSAVEDPNTPEGTLQSLLQENLWIFGGRYVGAAARRTLTVLDQFDIPLIRADGALHIVELKKANDPRLVVKHRNHPSVGPEVHLATVQAMNYLASLDRHETVIRADFGIDCRRSFATVVIGHPRHVQGFDADQVSEALRIYNSHLSRVEVITYDELVEGAKRSIAIAAADDDDDES